MSPQDVPTAEEYAAATVAWLDVTWESAFDVYAIARVVIFGRDYPVTAYLPRSWPEDRIARHMAALAVIRRRDRGDPN